MRYKHSCLYRTYVTVPVTTPGLPFDVVRGQMYT